jgi:hypothetical protein
VFPKNELARVRHFAPANLEGGRGRKAPDPLRDGRLPHWLEATRELRRLVGDGEAIVARTDQRPFGLCLYATSRRQAIGLRA